MSQAAAIAERVQSAPDALEPFTERVGEGRPDDLKVEVAAETKRGKLIINYNRPWHYPKQQEAIFEPKDKFGNPARYSFIEASTKAGKTRGCISWLAEQAIMTGKDGRNYWWVAPVHPQARIAYTRMKRAIKSFVLKSNDTDGTLTLLNGSVIWFKSGEKPDNLYGEDVWAVVIDEASRVREEAWHACRSVLTFTRGPVRAIGNVKGRKNWFYRLSRQAEAGAAGSAYYKMTAWDAVREGILKKAEIEDAQRKLPDQAYRELYLAEPADDGGNPFGLNHIAGCIAPMADTAPFACGVDLAKSEDWTVVIALDRNGDMCGFERWQAPWSVTTPRVSALIGGTPSLVDETGVGSPIVESLQASNPRVEGFIFTGQSRQALLVGLASAIQNREITFSDPTLIKELESFEYEYTARGVRYTAPEGFHDDTVMALALAVEQRRRLNPNIKGTDPKGPVAASAWISDEETEDL